MKKEEFIAERTRIISEMLDNPSKNGIYPTTKCFEQLDALFDKIIERSIEKRQNFISVDKKMVMNSYGNYFFVGEKVKHEDGDAGEATIINFELNVENNEIRVNTDKGFAHIDFLVKVR